MDKQIKTFKKLKFKRIKNIPGSNVAFIYFETIRGTEFSFLIPDCLALEFDISKLNDILKLSAVTGNRFNVDYEIFKVGDLQLPSPDMIYIFRGIEL